MHIRISSVTRNGRRYEYAQLVESFRRPSDGTPTVRVLAKLGSPGGLEVANMREALAAARAGERVAVLRHGRATKPAANLRYLDLAVLLHVCREIGLEEILGELMPKGKETIAPASVVVALVLQRCSDPGSKLYATRWLPRTALPELLRVPPSSFNNTRVHRVLDDLDGATRGLMAKLPSRYVDRDGAFASLFLDVTDTWFVGGGPALAARGKTKEGLIERKVGIVLLCNEHGFPLRWEVVPGSCADCVAMSRMFSSIAGVSWASEAPLVCDRAMGRTAQIREMLATDLRFVTALTVTEFDAYAPTLPHAAFAELEGLPDECDAVTIGKHIDEAARTAEAAGLTKLEDDQFVRDLGIVVRDEEGREDVPSTAGGESMTVRAMRLARAIEDAVAQGRYASDAAAGRSLGISKGLAAKYLRLRRLSEQQQRDVLEGKVAHASLEALLSVAKRSTAEERQTAFEVLAATPAPERPKAPLVPSVQDKPRKPVRVRVGVYFNPKRFVEERRLARQQIDRIQNVVTEYRAKIAAHPGRHDVRKVSAFIDRTLREASLIDAFEVSVSAATDDRGVEVDVRLDRAEWARRRRYDGFTVIVAHPGLTQSTETLCRLYRAKDAVEKDFRVIKSFVLLRPVRHFTDAKVRAHVTICILALLLERILHRALRATGTTAEAALDALAECRLNVFRPRAGSPAYVTTEIDADQRAILKALRLLHLADDAAISEKIRPR